MSKEKVNYGIDNIRTIEGIEHIRTRPEMYIGTVKNPNHLFLEAVDNAVDEYRESTKDDYTVKVTLFKDGAIEIKDDGRGIPVGINEEGDQVLESIFLKMNTGGKFGGSGGYKISSGLHGVGNKCISALSTDVLVTVMRDGGKYEMQIKDQEVVGSVKKVGKVDKDVTGSTVKFNPDKAIFKSTKFDKEAIKDRLVQVAYLYKGITAVYEDEETEEVLTFKYDDGIVGYVQEESEHYGRLLDTQLIKTVDEKTGIEVEIAFTWTDRGEQSKKVLSFANGVKTINGGTHETAFLSNLTRTVNNYAVNNGLSKKRLDSMYIQDGLMSIINVSIPEQYLKYEGQTKHTLATDEVKPIIKRLMEEELTYILSNNDDFTSYLVEKAIELKKAKQKMSKLEGKIKASVKKAKAGRVISDKLTEPINVGSGSNSELYIVEGDSAGGNAKKVRDREYQGVLALRGKVLNTAKATRDRLENNKELMTLVSALGVGIGKDVNYDKLRYEKLIILTDADVDGAHIQMLLLTFIHRFYPELIERGHVYIAAPPLFGVELGGGKYDYFWDKDEAKAKHPNKEMRRFKGLGEQSAESLKETSMCPKTRILKQVQINDVLATSRLFDTFMGDKASRRQEYIQSHSKEWFSTPAEF